MAGNTCNGIVHPKLLRFSHQTDLLVNMKDIRGSASLMLEQQASESDATDAGADSCAHSPSTAAPSACRQQEFDEEDDNLSIAEGELVIIDEVNPQDAREQQEDEDCIDSPKIANGVSDSAANGPATIAAEAARQPAERITAQKLDTLAEATKEFFKNHPLDVMELQLKSLIPSPSKRYIRMHCRPENGESHESGSSCFDQLAGRKPTQSGPMPASSRLVADCVPVVGHAACTQPASMVSGQSDNSAAGYYTRFPFLHQSNTMAQRPPMQQSIPSHQPLRYYQQYQHQRFSYGLNDPYSSRYMQHRDDKYQPYPIANSGHSDYSVHKELFYQQQERQQRQMTLSSQVSPSAATRAPITGAAAHSWPGGSTPALRTQLSQHQTTTEFRRPQPPPPPQSPQTPPPVQQPQPRQRKRPAQSSGRGRRSRMTGDRCADQQWQCGLCGIIFPECSLYDLHMQFHDPYNIWQCSVCTYRASGVFDFNQHLVLLPHQMASTPKSQVAGSCGAT